MYPASPCSFVDHVILLGHSSIKAQGSWQDVAPVLREMNSIRDNKTEQSLHSSHATYANEAALDKVRVMQDTASNISQTSKGEGVYRKCTKCNIQETFTQLVQGTI